MQKNNALASKTVLNAGGVLHVLSYYLRGFNKTGRLIEENFEFPSPKNSKYKVKLLKSTKFTNEHKKYIYFDENNNSPQDCINYVQEHFKIGFFDALKKIEKDKINILKYYEENLSKDAQNKRLKEEKLTKNKEYEEKQLSTKTGCVSQKNLTEMKSYF